MNVRLAAVSLMLVCLPPAVSAQDVRLQGRLDARTRTAVQQIVDSAAASGLPTEPLIDKALEGASKGADDARIVTAVRSLARRLRESRVALGSSANEAELVAGAGALSQGIASSTLSRLRSVRPAERITLPLVVLTDLIARGVPPSTASSVIVSLAGTVSGSDAFSALRRDVQQDIVAGADPAAAVSLRARALLAALPPPPGKVATTTDLEAASTRPPD
ncbi:MAG: hypothetical protein H7Z74_16270 [Anaerolineae bacterium]|nr:hypothetical protein [Gemmatimonadaceae bacterium]